MLGNLSLGQAGLERLDAEIRFHAHTVARLEKSKQATRDALAAEARRKEECDEYREAAEQLDTAYKDERAAHRQTKGISIAAFVALLIRRNLNALMEFFTTMLSESSEWTISKLTANSPQGEVLCYILQDGRVGGGKDGKGRIPAGRYMLGLRTKGSMHLSYRNRYMGKPGFHAGMIELLNVPNYTAILFHVGNNPTDTLGCLLSGTKPEFKEGVVRDSRRAYEKVYPILRDAVRIDHPSYITISYTS